MDNPNPPKFERPEDRPKPPPNPPRKRLPIQAVEIRHTSIIVPSIQRVELEKLAQDLYNDGYACGITEDEWFTAYALAMEKIVAGAPFTDKLVLDCFNELEKGDEE